MIEYVCVGGGGGGGGTNVTVQLRALELSAQGLPNGKKTGGACTPHPGGYIVIVETNYRDHCMSIQTTIII